MVIWEGMFKQKWSEYKTSLPHLEDKKRSVIKSVRLAEDVFTLQDLKAALEKEGILFSLSLREKIQFLNEQSSYIEALKIHYIEKKDGMLSEGRYKSVSMKLKNLLEKEASIRDELKFLKEDYRRLFKEESKIKI